MRWLKLARTAFLFLCLVFAAVGAATPAYAHHSLAGGAECGERSFDAELTKGRTDSMLVIVDHTVDCKTYHYRNYVGADCIEYQDAAGGVHCRPASMSERIWQANECQRVGKLDVARFFEMYFDTPIDPATIKVSCPLYSGPD